VKAKRETMSDFVDKFSSKIDEIRVRAVFPEMTDSETPIWRGSPHFFSMIGHYILALNILIVHVLFFWASFSPVVEEQELSVLIGFFSWILDFSGVLGFAIFIFVIAKINHYLNCSTSNKWTTMWLIVNGSIPLILVITDLSARIFETIAGGYVNTPQWTNMHYLTLGILSSGLIIILSALYQSSFQYAITNRRIHIRKRFLYLDTSAHGISFDNIENLKVDPSILGRILGFGNVHILTASGIGLREDESGIGAGMVTEAESITGDSRRGIVRVIFGWISAQRQRTTVDQNPEDCLYGVRNPMDIYRLIHELIDIR